MKKMTKGHPERTRRIHLIIILMLGFSFLETPIFAQENVPGQYIIVFKDWIQNSKAKADTIAWQHGIGLKHIYEHALKGCAATIPSQKLADIQADPDVKYISNDVLVVAFENVKNPNPGARGNKPVASQPPQQLPTGINRINAELNFTARIDGVDQRVNSDIAIIDTGIDKKHPDLNVVGGVNFTNGNLSNFSDGNGHGTHVAGTTAAIDNGIGVVGVAPGARLWAVKVLNNQGSGFLSDVIEGIDWVTQNASTIEVANMSLGWSGTNTNLLDPAHEAIRNSVNAGVVYVVAAGNSSSDSENFAPASYDEVITVSAIADSDGLSGGLGTATSYGADDTFATFSNFGADVDMAAPGVNILSTWLNGGYATISGTSMATPHVTGLAALYIAQYGKPADAIGVEALKNALIQFGTPQSSVDGFSGDPDTFAEPLGSGAF